jgi:hypothetical protein
MTEVFSYLAQIQYDEGIDPLDHAIECVKLYIDTWGEVHDARQENPATYPILSAWDATSDSFARRIIAQLLDAGWVVPKLEDLRTKGGDQG